MLRESYTTIRLLLGLVVIGSMLDLFALPQTPVEMFFYVFNVAVGFGALYLAWDIRTLVSRWHARINLIVWVVFIINSLGSLYLVYSSPVENIALDDVLIMTIIGFGITFYVTWNVRRLALWGEPTGRKGLSKTKFMYWGVLIVVLSVLTYFIVRSLGTLY